MSRHVNSCNSIFNVYIADGFSDDCDELIRRCTQISTLSYEKFCDVWKEMQFGAIFHGRSSCAELGELSEEVLFIAKRYMVANSINFEETVAGLFLVYGLLNLQPFANFASVRFVPDDVVALDRIEMEARKTRRQDVLYILGSVLICGPCQFHVMERERGIEYPIRKYLEGMTTIDSQGVRPKGVFFRQNEEMEIIRELGRLNKLYKDAKVSLGVSDKSLKYVNENFADELDASLKKIIGGSVDNNFDNDCDTDDENDGGAPVPKENVHSIKDKAMKSSIQPMKHLMSVEERKKSPKKKSTKTKGDKSPKKGQSKSPQKNRRVRCRKRGRKKMLSRECSDSGEDDTEYLSLPESDGENLNSDDDITEDNNESVPDVEVDGNIDIKVQSLPSLDNINREFEIEFIDYTKSDKLLLSNEAKSKNSNSNKTLDIKAVSNKLVVETTVTDEAKSSDSDNTFKKPVLDATILKLLEKRNLKKPRVHTKFKRMGMLPVANFKDRKSKNTKNKP